MSNSEARRNQRRPAIGLMYRLLAAGYIAAVLLLSYREGMTIFAKAAGSLLLVGALLQMVMSGRRLVVPVSYRIWLAWYCWSLLLLPFATNMDVALFKALSLAQIVPAGLLLTNYLLWNGVTRFYQLALVGAALASCVMVWGSPATFSGIDGRVFGPLGNANAFGALLVAALVFVLAEAVADSNWVRRPLWLGAAGVLFLMITQTGSRQALIGSFIAAATTIGVYLLRAKSISFGAIAGTIFGVALLVPVTMSYVGESDFWFRTENAVDTLKSGDLANADGSIAGRIWLYQRAAQIAMDAPLTGVGLDNFRVQKALNSGSQIGGYSHSNYMEVLVSSGLPGFVLYFSMYWLWIRSLYRLKNLIFDPVHFGRYVRVLVLAVTFMVLDLTSVSYDGKFQWLVFAWLIAELDLLRDINVRSRLQRNSRPAEDAETEKMGVAGGRDQYDHPRQGQVST
jgi:O-antigen ligase